MSVFITKNKIVGRKVMPLEKAFVLDVKTDNAGTSNSDQFTIPTTGTGYNYNVDWGDGTTSTGVTGNITHTFPSAGTYRIRITGTMPRIFFNNGGDRLKLIKIVKWGDVNRGAEHRNSFHGCTNVTSLPNDSGWMNNIAGEGLRDMFNNCRIEFLPRVITLPLVTITVNMFSNCNLTSLPSGMTLPLLTNGNGMFNGNNLTSLPSGMELPLLNSGQQMFQGNSLTSIPSGMQLPLLTLGLGMFNNNNLTSLPSAMELPLLNNGQTMFQNNNLTSLPSGMELPLLVTGTSMFQGNSLTSLPSGMELPLLNNGQTMFQGNSLTSLPSGMELPLLTQGNGMFYLNNLTSLPSGMTLNNLLVGGSVVTGMFRGNSLTDLPAGMKLSSLTNGQAMFFGNTINTTRYSQLLVDLEADNPNNNVPFHGGNSKYNTTGETARNILTSAPRNWTITDGGLE